MAKRNKTKQNETKQNKTKQNLQLRKALLDCFSFHFSSFFPSQYFLLHSYFYLLFYFVNASSSLLLFLSVSNAAAMTVKQSRQSALIPVRLSPAVMQQHYINVSSASTSF
jgi:hypothetical protein